VVPLRDLFALKQIILRNLPGGVMEAVQISANYLSSELAYEPPKTLNRHEKGEVEIYRKIDPGLREIEGNIFLVKEKGGEVIDDLKGMLEILDTGFKEDGYGHHYRGPLNVLFRRIKSVNSNINAYNSDMCRNNGHPCINSKKLKAEFGFPPTLPILEDRDEWRFFCEKTKEADRTHYNDHPADYWP
jgi:hypothetical protein